MARGYWVVTFRSVSDERGVDAYADASLPAIQHQGGRVLAAGVPAFTHEAGSGQRVAVVEFESLEAAEAAYLSQEYQASLQHLAGSAVRDVRIVEGLELLSDACAASSNDDRDVRDVVQKYLRGIYAGDAAALREVFHESARVEDRVTGKFRSRTAAEYIAGVASRQSPLAAGEAFTMVPTSITVLGDMAAVTADLRFLGGHYLNVLSLLRDNGRWRIVQKLFGPSRA